MKRWPTSKRARRATASSSMQISSDPLSVCHALVFVVMSCFRLKDNVHEDEGKAPDSSGRLRPNSTLVLISPSRGSMFVVPPVRFEAYVRRRSKATQGDLAVLKHIRASLCLLLALAVLPHLTGCGITPP